MQRVVPVNALQLINRLTFYLAKVALPISSQDLLLGPCNQDTSGFDLISAQLKHMCTRLSIYICHVFVLQIKGWTYIYFYYAINICVNISINDADTPVADVGVSSGRKRERGHAYRHGELPKEEQSGDGQDAPRHPSSAGHHHIVAGDYFLLFLSRFTCFSNICAYISRHRDSLERRRDIVIRSHIFARIVCVSSIFCWLTSARDMIFIQNGFKKIHYLNFKSLKTIVLSIKENRNSYFCGFYDYSKWDFS